jgi:hypothetical protein
VSIKKTLGLCVVVFVVYVVHCLIAYIEYPKDNRVAFGPKKAIVVGATSGMGRRVAKLLASDGYEVGLVGRRVYLLKSLQDEICNKTYAKKIDVSHVEKAKKKLESLIDEMGGLDLMFISLSCLRDIDCTKPSSERSWSDVKKFLNVDARGFWVAAHVATRQFEKQKHGHLVGISSIDGVRGASYSPEYAGAKAFVSTYLEGMRNNFYKRGLPIYMTEIIPGPVNVERQDYSKIPGMYWISSSQDAAKIIYDAIKKKKERAYVSKRWGLMAHIFTKSPGWFYRWID